MKLKAKHVFFSLCSFFILYSFNIYLKPLNQSKNSENNKSTVAKTRLVWQKYNCQSCHQLFGLGGYLGPDITNITSNPNKGKDYIKAMLSSGVKQMPVFKLSDDEIDDLYLFLSSVNETGKADPRNFKISNSGMIH